MSEKRGCFGWEHKSRGGDLGKAHEQLLRCAGALENPPLLITSDMHRIIRTNWTNTAAERVHGVEPPTSIQGGCGGECRPRARG